MLLRAVTTGLTAEWLLVPQVAHARLSGMLAAAWAGDAFGAIEPHADLVAAIARHDDGWEHWDLSPEVEPGLGRPLSFLEMPLDAALAIWRRSIALATSVGPLAQYVISGHFSALLEMTATRWRADPDQEPRGRRFLLEQSLFREGWLADWQKPDPPRRPPELAERGLRYLQYFDTASLWLCLAERTTAETFSTPGGDVTVTPIEPGQFRVAPWPFSPATLETRVPAYRLPAGARAPDGELSLASLEPAELAIRLVG